MEDQRPDTNPRLPAETVAAFVDPLRRAGAGFRKKGKQRTANLRRGPLLSNPIGDPPISRAEIRP